MKKSLVTGLVALASIAAACAQDPTLRPAESPAPDAPGSAFVLSSSAFEDSGSIPTKYTCKGEDLSPPLAWHGAPKGTVQFALILDDPDAGGFVHWVLYSIDDLVTGVDEGKVPEGALQGTNDFPGNPQRYGGPCPPSGVHQYDFRLFALSANPGINAGLNASRLRARISDVVIGEAVLVGRFAA